MGPRPQPGPPTLLLVVEDLHWCDPTSLDVLARLMDQIADRSLLLVVTARPEFADPCGTPSA